jgi:hypothetical protein
MELVQLKTDKDHMIKEDQGGFLAFRSKSQFNKEFLIFVPFIPDKRICPWEAINKLIEYNEILIKTLPKLILLILLCL